jgi:hypothetical protein
MVHKAIPNRRLLYQVVYYVPVLKQKMAMAKQQVLAEPAAAAAAPEAQAAAPAEETEAAGEEAGPHAPEVISISRECVFVCTCVA